MAVRYHAWFDEGQKVATRSGQCVDVGEAMTAAIVLSAGLGTRLAPLTDELAKPLMPVGDRPVLAHVVEALGRGGVTRIVANTHHRAADFQRKIDHLTAKVHFLHEPRILGTAGGVANAASALGDGPIVVWNGDILAPDLDVLAVVAEHARGGAGVLWVVEPTAPGTGTVGLDDTGCIVRLRGQQFGSETSGGEFLGIQVMGADLRRALPREGCLVADVALPFLRRGGRIAAFPYRGAWDDIGQPASLLRANLRWLERHRCATWSAKDAKIDAGAVLEQSLAGKGAVVAGVGAVRECVIFPGARLTAPAARMLVGERAALAVP